MTDRPLDHNELLDLKEGRTLTKVPYFINALKNDTMESNGRNSHIPPSLYEMVLLELIARTEVLTDTIVRLYALVSTQQRKEKE
jgi:hypothetical protein